VIHELPSACRRGFPVERLEQTESLDFEESTESLDLEEAVEAVSQVEPGPLQPLFDVVVSLKVHYLSDRGVRPHNLPPWSTTRRGHDQVEHTAGIFSAKCEIKERGPLGVSTAVCYCSRTYEHDRYPTRVP
jgi:hypothetical protein